MPHRDLLVAITGQSFGVGFKLLDLVSHSGHGLV